MQKQEFEERIERTVTDEQYKVIEEVYMWHPSIRNTSGKDEVAELYKSFGMTIFHDMLPRAKKAHELDELLRNAQREVQRIQEEIEELWSLGTWSESSFSMTKETGQSTLKSLHRSILEKVREHSTDTPRHTLKHPHGRTSLRRKTEQGVSSSRFSACAGSQKKPDAFQVSSRRSNRLSRIYGSMRTLPETKEPVRCCMRS